MFAIISGDGIIPKAGLSEVVAVKISVISGEATIKAITMHACNKPGMFYHP